MDADIAAKGQLQPSKLKWLGLKEHVLRDVYSFKIHILNKINRMYNKWYVRNEIKRCAENAPKLLSYSMYKYEYHSLAKELVI